MSQQPNKISYENKEYQEAVARMPKRPPEDDKDKLIEALLQARFKPQPCVTTLTKSDYVITRYVHIAEVCHIETAVRTQVAFFHGDTDDHILERFKYKILCFVEKELQ